MAAETDDPGDEESPKKSKKGLLVGLVLAIVGAGGGYFVTSSGLLGGGAEVATKAIRFSDDVAFVPVDPMTISMGRPADQRYLRFRAQLEVNADYESDVEALMPRVVDVLNTYLRSITMTDVEDPSSLLELRSQMRRRIDLVVGGDKINDLLVMEFVVN
ncbi:MAG: flagellar basal body-associated FliL family protein [Boseongicola sp.]